MFSTSSHNPKSLPTCVNAALDTLGTIPLIENSAPLKLSIELELGDNYDSDSDATGQSNRIRSGFDWERFATEVGRHHCGRDIVTFICRGSSTYGRLEVVEELIKEKLYSKGLKIEIVRKIA